MNRWENWKIINVLEHLKDITQFTVQWKERKSKYNLRSDDSFYIEILTNKLLRFQINRLDS